MQTLRSALLIAANDLRRRFRNRSFIIQAFVGPLVLAIVISAAFGGGFGFDITVGIANQDHSELATSVTRQLLKGGAGAQGVDFIAVRDAAAAKKAIDDADIGAAIVIPEGFGDAVAAPVPKALGLVTDDQYTVPSAVARAVADGIAARINAGRLAGFTLAADGHPVPDPAALAAIDLPVSLDQRGSGSEVSPAASVAPGLGLLFLFLATAGVARSLLEEKRRRVLDRIRAAPVSITAILLGKALGMVIVGFVSTATLWGATSVLLGADWGDPTGVVVLILCGALAVAGLGAIIAGISRDEQAAEMAATMAAFVFGIIGGSLVPLSQLPAGLLRLSKLSPNGWALTGFAELSAGSGHVGDVLLEAGVLLVWAAVGFGVGAVVLSRRMGAR